MQKILLKLLYEKETTVFDRSLDFLIALLPAVIAGTLYFGFRALLCMLLCAAASVLSEWLFSKLLSVKSDPRNLSAIVCGLLIGMTMPSGFSIPAAVICAFFAMPISRVMFGGVGCEIVSPVALGAVLAFVCFPTLFKYTDAFTGISVSSSLISPVSTDYSMAQLLFGAHAGAIGETAALFLAAGALYLAARRVISLVMPLCALLGTALFSFVFRVDVLPAVLGGGVILASVFILTDKTFCPRGVLGKIATGLVFGFITVIIRKYAAADEGVYFAVLTVNILRPLFEAIPDTLILRRRDRANG